MEISKQEQEELYQAFREDSPVNEINLTSSGSRYEIVEYLLEQEKDRATLTDIAEEVDKHPATVTKHLERLMDEDLVEQRQKPGGLYRITEYGRSIADLLELTE